MCMFLVNIEVPIVATSLTAITNDLDGFRQQGWVVTAYLVTYGSGLLFFPVCYLPFADFHPGMMVIWSKLSGLFGRKPTVLLALLIFIIFSGACGGAKSMVALSVCSLLCASIADINPGSYSEPCKGLVLQEPFQFHSSLASNLFQYRNGQLRLRRLA